jgi:hypothetical protein
VAVTRGSCPGMPGTRQIIADFDSDYCDLTVAATVTATDCDLTVAATVTVTATDCYLTVTVCIPFAISIKFTYKTHFIELIPHIPRSASHQVEAELHAFNRLSALTSHKALIKQL